ncbi:MAG: hypothetical protein MUO42_05910 [Anaerolineaceae bacterium]|nr:hypothetical protein [Anaerolineaceae bacterium]
MTGNFSVSTYILIMVGIGLFAAGYTLWMRIIKPITSGPPASLTLPDKLPAKGFSVPLIDAYGGIKDLDRATVTQNFQKPKLILFDDHLVYKLIFRRSAKYSDILEVNAGSQFAEYFLQFTFKGRTLVLTVTMLDPKLHTQVMDFLSSKGVMVIE